MDLASWVLRLRYRRQVFGPGFRGPLGLRIRGPGRVRFGRDVRVTNIFGRTALLTFGRGARIEIGDRVRIDGAGMMAATEIVVDPDAILGACLIVDTDFHAVGLDRRRAHAAADQRPIRIGRNAWIQDRATILKGVTVGEGAVVRCAAVVASDVASGAVVAGNPAAVVGTG